MAATTPVPTGTQSWLTGVMDLHDLDLGLARGVPELHRILWASIDVDVERRRYLSATRISSVRPTDSP